MSLPYRSLAFPLFLLIAGLLFHRHLNGYYFVDDAYIYLQTVRNFVSGEGWGFNAGELVNACSSTLYFLLLSLGGWIGYLLAPQHISWILVWLTVLIQGLCLAGMATLVLRGMGEDEPVSRWILAFALAFHPIFVFSSGMESALFALMLVLSISLYLDDRWLLAGLALAGLCLTRPEGVLLIPLLVLCKPPPHLGAWKLGLIGFLLPVVLWSGFSLWYFDSLLANSTSNKLDQTVSLGAANSYFMRFFRFTWFAPLSVLLAVVGCYELLQRLRSGNLFLPLLVLYGLVQGAGYGFAGAKGSYFWYYMPAYLAFTVLLYWGLRTPCLWLSRWLDLKLVTDRSPAGICLVLLGLVAVFSLGVMKPMEKKEYRNAREYVRISEFVRTQTSGDSRVAALEIGYIGYFSNHVIVDPYGLIHAPVAGDRRETLIETLMRYEPEVIVLPAAWVNGTLPDVSSEHHRRFAAMYEKSDEFGRLGVLVLASQER